MFIAAVKRIEDVPGSSTQHCLWGIVFSSRAFEVVFHGWKDNVKSFYLSPHILFRQYSKQSEHTAHSKEVCPKKTGGWVNFPKLTEEF